VVPHSRARTDKGHPKRMIPLLIRYNGNGQTLLKAVSGLLNCNYHST